jgi:tetratricopeptide (TPR) repeat protein
MANDDKGKKGAPPIADDRKRKLAADCWKRGTEAMMKSNWDYSISMFREATKLVPDNLIYRQSLRGCEEKKYNGNGSGAAMAGMKLMGVRGKIKKARYSKDWATIEQAAEDGLAINPWDAQLNADAGDALREFGYQEVAVYCFERAVKGDPNNKEYNQALGELLEERGEFERAIACYKRIMAVDKLDTVSRRKITELEAKATMEHGGYEKADSTQSVKITGKTVPGETAAPGDSPESDLQRAIRKDPANKDNYLKLAALYKRGGKLESCEEQLKKALEVSGGDINIREQVEDIQLDRMRQALGVAKDAALKAADDADAKQRYSELAEELLRRETEIFSRRVERYPNDMRLKFELAQRYVTDQKHQLAIPLFQQSRSDPRLRGESLLLLGECFIRDKQYALAKRQFEQAVPDVKFDEKPDRFKELNYYLGRICEKLSERDNAIKWYQEVLAVDYNYRDTQKRLQALESGGQAEGKSA